MAKLKHMAGSDEGLEGPNVRLYQLVAHLWVIGSVLPSLHLAWH